MTTNCKIKLSNGQILYFQSVWEGKEINERLTFIFGQDMIVDFSENSLNYKGIIGTDEMLLQWIKNQLILNGNIILEPAQCVDNINMIDIKVKVNPNIIIHSRTVYITEHGDHYHSYSCNNMGRYPKPINLYDAIKQNYTPCTLCGGGRKPSYQLSEHSFLYCCIFLLPMIICLIVWFTNTPFRIT